MLLIVPVWQGRVSPLLDAARRLLVVDIDEAGTAQRDSWEVRLDALDDGDKVARAKRLLALGGHVLLCGAISAPLESLLTSGGLRVIRDRCGPVEQVVEALLERRLTQSSFLMPGCGGQARGQGRRQQRNESRPSKVGPNRGGKRHASR